jgi:WXG100 family type VII secretion target
MADIVQANYESLVAVAKQFVQQSNKIRQMHDRLNRQMALLRPAWVGKGSEAFLTEMGDKVLPAVQRLSAALADADRVTRQIEEILHGAEEQASSPFQQDEEPVLRALPYDPGADLGGAGGSDGGGGGAGDEASGSAGGSDEGTGTEEELAYPGGSRDFDKTGGGESGGTDDGLTGGVEGELEGGAGGLDQGVGGKFDGIDSDGLGTDFLHGPEDFGREFLIDNSGSGLGGAWDEDSFRPFDMDNVTLNELYQDHGFGVTGDFGGGEVGSLGPGGDSSFTVPNDWLVDVEKAFGSSWTDDLEQDLGAAGGSGSGGSGIGSASGGGVGSGGSFGDEGGMGGGTGSGGGSGSGSNMGGSTRSGGAPMGSAIPAGGMGQTSTGGMSFSREGSLGMTGQAVGAALPKSLRYTASAGGGAGIKAAAMGSEMRGAAAAPAAAATPQAAQANVGVPMGLAALAPLLALVGKAVKDRSSGH